MPFILLFLSVVRCAKSPSLAVCVCPLYVSFCPSCRSVCLCLYNSKTCCALKPTSSKNFLNGVKMRRKKPFSAFAVFASVLASCASLVSVCTCCFSVVTACTACFTCAFAVFASVLASCASLVSVRTCCFSEIVSCAVSCFASALAVSVAVDATSCACAVSICACANSDFSLMLSIGDLIFSLKFSCKGDTSFCKTSICFCRLFISFRSFTTSTLAVPASAFRLSLLLSISAKLVLTSCTSCFTLFRFCSATYVSFAVSVSLSVCV